MTAVQIQGSEVLVQEAEQRNLLKDLNKRKGYNKIYFMDILIKKITHLPGQGCKCLLILQFALLSVTTVLGQDEHDAAAAQANNPLANMTALNFHNYFMPVLNDAPDEAYMNTSWIRFARPFARGRLLLRVSVPLNTVALPESGVVKSTNGLGDINAFLSYNFVSKPTTTMGIGPMITAPTASNDALGTGKWQGGFAFVAFVAKSPVFQFGGLITWQVSFAGDEDRSSTSVAAIQPFYFWQLGKGTYLRGAPIWAFDLENEAYSVPLALGIGKVVKLGNTVFNLFAEPQYALLIYGTQPQFQVFTGINLQFVSK